VSSKSSPTVSVQYPPTASTSDRLKRPNAPETIPSASSLLQPTRATRKARKYSSTWIVARRLAGAWTSRMRPWSTRQPLTIRIVPPVAARSCGSSRIGFETFSSESASSRESASITQTYSFRAALIPALSASERPPFSLSSTSRPGCVRETYVFRTGAVGMPSRSATLTGVRANADFSASIVRSVEPSLTTTTSCLG
jgi:hypothetical protein